MVLHHESWNISFYSVKTPIIFGTSEISNESKKTVRYDLETVKYRTPLLWGNLPDTYKTATYLNSFKIN